jgi:2-dehydropantoate 2-reductase
VVVDDCLGYQTRIHIAFQGVRMSGESPRIGIIGGGSIGGFFGFLLARAGFDVHFLLRSEYEAVARDGLVVRGKKYSAMQPLPVNAYRSVDDMPQCEWLFIGAKATSNVDLAPLLEKVALPGAKVVSLQNGLGVEDALRPMLPDSLHLLGGLCWVGVHRDGPGIIRHIALGDIHLGYHSGPAEKHTSPQEILNECVAMFQASQFNARAIPDLVEGRWRKLVWNIPYNGLSALLKTGTQSLTGNPDSHALLVDLMNEVVAGAAACGYAMPEGLPEQLIDLTAPLDDYLPSMYFDSVLHRPMELDVMYAAPLAAAKRAGCSLPRTEALYRSLRFMEAKAASGAGPDAA